MNTLRTYLNSLPVQEQQAFAARVGTSIGYLRKAICVGAKLDGALAIRIERESGGQVHCEDLRPDADWAFVRKTCRSEIRQKMESVRLAR